jgi:hypothetical protein
MAQVIDLTQEEIEKLRDLNDKFGKTLNSIGDIEIKLNLVRKKEEELKKEKDLLFSDYAKLREKETELSQDLLKKYGEGTIDLSAGKIEVV